MAIVCDLTNSKESAPQFKIHFNFLETKTNYLNQSQYFCTTTSKQNDYFMLAIVCTQNIANFLFYKSYFCSAVEGGLVYSALSMTIKVPLISVEKYLALAASCGSLAFARATLGRSLYTYLQVNHGAEYGKIRVLHSPDIIVFKFFSPNTVMSVLLRPVFYHIWRRVIQSLINLYTKFFSLKTNNFCLNRFGNEKPLS